MFRRDCDGLGIPVDQIDFEEFLGFLDIEFFLGLRGSDTGSEDGNETQVLIKTLIAEILTELTPQPERIPELYVQFARRGEFRQRYGFLDWNRTICCFDGFTEETLEHLFAV